MAAKPKTDARGNRVPGPATTPNPPQAPRQGAAPKPKTAAPATAPVPVFATAPSYQPPAAEPIVPTDAKGFQTYLNQLGAKPPLVVDGKIGPKTLAAAAQAEVKVPDNLAPKPAAQPAAPTQTAPTQQQAEPESTPVPAPLTAQQAQDRVKSQFGYLGALLDHPDVAAALASAVSQDLTDQQALALLYDTPTWRNSSAAQRNWEALTPGDQQAQVTQTKTGIAAQARKLGVDIGDERLTQIASDAARLGWNQAQVDAAVAAEFHYKPGGQVGQIGQAEATIRADAHDYRVSDLLGDTTMASYDAQIAAGTLTPEEVKQQLVTLAQQRFPGLAGQITVSNPTKNALAPYANAAANELGIDPDTIDFAQPMWSKAVNQIDDKGNHVPLPIYEWQRTLRSDPTYGWDKTPNGVASGYAVGNTLAQALGLRQ
jgi:hypothetical protein